MFRSRISALSQAYPFLSSLCLTFLFFIAFFCCFTSQYGTTDDVEMQMVLSGYGVLQAPSPYLRYTHIGIGQAIATLYELAPSIPWYGSYLYAAHFLGFWAISYSFLALQAGLFRLALLGLLFGSIEIRLLQELQFTSSALMLGFGGILLASIACFKAWTSSSKKMLFVAATLLLFVAMMRFDSFILSIILGGPVLLFSLYKNRQHLALKVGITFTLLLGAWALQQTHFQLIQKEKGWKDFHTYQSLLVGQNMYDYKLPMYTWTAESAPDYYHKVGWSYEDWYFLNKWFLADSTVYGIKPMLKIHQHFKDKPYPEGYLKQKSLSFLQKYPFTNFIFHSFLIALLALLFIPYSPPVYLLIGTVAAETFALLFTLGVFKHLPERVSFPLCAFLVIISLLFIGFKHKIALRQKIILLTLLSLFTIDFSKTAFNKSSTIKAQQKAWLQALKILKPKANQLYTGGGDFYMEKAILPLTNTADSLFQNFNMLDFGHLSNTPTFYKQLDNFGIKNIHLESINNSALFFIARPNNTYRFWYKDFLYRHYDKEIYFETALINWDLNIAVYKIKTK